MLSFFSRFQNKKIYSLSKFIPYTVKQTSYTYDTQIDKYIRKIESDLQKKNQVIHLPKVINLSKDIHLPKDICPKVTFETKLSKYFTNHNDSVDNSLLPIVGFICFLAGYNLSKISLV
jgi:hypothetical protein